jgi:hypothetical protein
MSSATSSLNGRSLSNASSASTPPSGASPRSHGAASIAGGDLQGLVDRLDPVGIDVVKAVPLLLVVLDPRPPALGRDRVARDCLLERRVLVAALVDEHEPGLPRLRP